VLTSEKTKVRNKRAHRNKREEEGRTHRLR
jgi:hypothetical protein